MLVDGIDVVDPDRHPDALVRPVVESMRRCKRALAASALAVLAQEDLALAGADAPKRGRTTPVPALLPAKLFKPGETLHNIWNVENRNQAFNLHDYHPDDCLALKLRGGSFNFSGLKFQVSRLNVPTHFSLSLVT